MPQTKIVFFDIDGTLIDMQAKKITPKMLETLHRLQDRGIKICIATGRSPMVLPKIDGVAFDAYLTFNGSLCYDRKGVIFSNPIPHKDVVRFIQNAAALGRPVCVSTRGRLAANGTKLAGALFQLGKQRPANAPVAAGFIGAEDDALWDTAKYIRRMQARLADTPHICRAEAVIYPHGTHFVFTEGMMKNILPIGSGLVVSLMFKAAKEHPKACKATREDIDRKVSEMIAA